MPARVAGGLVVSSEQAYSWTVIKEQNKNVVYDIHERKIMQSNKPKKECEKAAMSRKLDVLQLMC